MTDGSSRAARWCTPSVPRVLIWFAAAAALPLVRTVGGPAAAPLATSIDGVVWQAVCFTLLILPSRRPRGRGHTV